jgi:hypothetical protein
MLGKTAEYRHEYSSDILLVAIAIVPSLILAVWIYVCGNA